MREKCDAVINMKPPNSVKECRVICGMVPVIISQAF